MLLLEDRRFFVYIYLDSRKPGMFEYSEFNFEFEPFYVGKGQRKRDIEHIEEIIGNRSGKTNLDKIKIISELLNLNLIPIIIKIMNLTEIEAYNLEKILIKLIGRRLLEEGPLTNIMPGGFCGCTCSEIMQTNEMRKIMRKRTNKYFSNLENRKKHSILMKRIMNDPKMKETVSKSQKARFKNISQRQIHSDKMKKKFQNPEYKDRIKLAVKSSWTEERLKSCSILQKEIQNREDVKKKKSEKRKGKYFCSKTCLLLNITGEKIIIQNPTRFCRENNLSYAGIILTKDTIKFHKNWRFLEWL